MGGAATVLTWLVAAIIALVTVLSYLPVFDADKEFTNWDDNVYVTEQPLVKSFDASTIATFFDPSTEVSSNYHPLTMISLAADHAMFGADASAFARTNLLFHVLNTFLLFWFVFRLLNGNLIVAGITAIVWGVHPMHVESVAWISERKDVLYAFFLLLSLLSYQRYLRSSNMLFLLGSTLAFVASCLSKAMAVPLPIALLVLDYYYRRGFSIRTVVEKLPMLAMSVWIGITALSIQSKTAIAKFDVITPLQRVAFAGYGFVMYWVKMLLPFELSTYYPYPTTGAGGEVNALYFLMPVVALAIVVVPIVFTRGRPDLRRMIVLAMAVFVLFVALVLQLISVGQVIMAERYTYVPYVGSVLLLAYGLWRLIERWRIVGWTLTSAFVVMCVSLTYVQAGVWKNSETLWTQVIERYPYEWTETDGSITVTRVGAAPAYGSRASYYMKKNMDDKAFADLRVLEIVQAPDWKGQQMLGVLYGRRNEYDKSIDVLTKVITAQPTNGEPYYNRGISYAMTGKSAQAAADFDMAIRNGVTGDELRMSMIGAAREHLNAKQHAACYEAASRLTAAYPNDAEGPFLAGTALVNLKRYDEAIEALTRAAAMKPDYAAAWFNMAVAHKERGERDKARAAAAKAAQLGFNVPEGAF